MSLMQAPKNGLFYVLEAAKGKLLAGKPYMPPLNWASGRGPADRPAGRESGGPLRHDRQAVHRRAIGARRAQLASDVLQPRTGLIYTPVVENSLAFNMDPKYQMRDLGLNGGTGASPATVYEDLHSTAPRSASGCCWPGIRSSGRRSGVPAIWAAWARACCRPPAAWSSRARPTARCAPTTIATASCCGPADAGRRRGGAHDLSGRRRAVRRAAGRLRHP